MSDKNFRRDRRHKMFDDRDDGDGQFYQTPPAFLNNGFRRQREDRVIEPAAAEEKVAEVKWFNATKGFGFVGIEGEQDAFLPASALSAMGLNSIDPGTILVVSIVRSPRGPQVSDIVEVKPSAAKPAPRAPSYGDMEPLSDTMRPAPKPVASLSGIVKLYNSEKGFGFVTPDSGGRDLFLHVSALTRSGMSDIKVGARVSVTVKEGRKGPEIDTVARA
jgi:CspA family cold shock protein